MKPAIGPDQQGEIFIVGPRQGAGSGDLEDLLCVFKQRSHAKHLSAAMREISEENANQ
jgi:hypothetical protein